MENKTVAIITARGGSKRILRKNIKDFLGFPIIKYSIYAALQAKCFDEVMVSTDDREIAKIAEGFGAKIPFFRSATASDDCATTSNVLEDVLSEYKKRGQQFDFACCIYPTAPFISVERLKQGYDLLRESGADTVLSVVLFSYPIQRAFKIEEGKLWMIWPENINARSQDLIPAYHDAGQFYWFRVESFMKNGRLFTENTIPIVIPEAEVQDIDNEEDWRIAEIKYKVLKKL